MCHGPGRGYAGVTDSISTHPSLLLRIRDSQDSLAWNEFAQLYAPIIHAFGRRRGLQEADAADVTQEVLRAVSRSVGRFQYEPSRGGFRHWLFTITRNKVKEFLSRAAAGAPCGRRYSRQGTLGEAVATGRGVNPLGRGMAKAIAGLGRKADSPRSPRVNLGGVLANGRRREGSRRSGGGFANERRCGLYRQEPGDRALRREIEEQGRQ